MPQPSRIAAATLLSHPSYLPGALVLGRSLERAGWRHDTLALVTPDVGEEDRQRLSRYWNTLQIIEPIGNPCPPESMGFETYRTVYSKLHLWDQTDFDRLVYLDADTMVMGSLDPLLEGRDFAAAPCFTAPDLFNSGMMALEPSKERFEDLMAKRSTMPSYDGGDQGFLNRYFSDWFTGDPARRLPMKFNVPILLSAYGPAWTRLIEDIRVLHFVGKMKPWRKKDQRTQEKRRFPLFGKSRRRRKVEKPWDGGRAAGGNDVSNARGLTQMWHRLYSET